MSAIVAPVFPFKLCELNTASAEFSQTCDLVLDTVDLVLDVGQALQDLTQHAFQPGHGCKERKGSCAMLNVWQWFLNHSEQRMNSLFDPMVQARPA